VILLVSKLQVGRVVRDHSPLNSAKKAFHTFLILLVSKLQDGKLVSFPPRPLNPLKK